MGMRALEVLVDTLSGRHVPARVEVPLEVILTRGSGTASISRDLAPEDRVRWDLPDELVLASGLGPTYSPRAFRIHYRGNRYNRSAAQPGQSRR
jgi:ribose transport system substrate-binding protein